METIEALYILAPHGLKGATKGKLLLADAASLPLNTPLPTNGTPKTLTLTKLQQGPKGSITCFWLESTTPESAAALRGLTLLLPEDLLPEVEDDEFYVADLFNRPVLGPEGKTVVGTFTGSQETAAHLLLVLEKSAGGEALIPLDDAETFLTLPQDVGAAATPLRLTELGLQLLDL